LEAIENHIDTKDKIFDYVLYNTNIDVENNVIKYYESEGSYIITPGDIDKFKDKYYFIGDNLLTVKNKHIVHNIKKIIRYISAD
jgi:hypothetical protein